MTIYERVLSAISQFGLDVAPQAYSGTKDRYFVVDVQMADTIDGDDEPVWAYYQVSLSLCTPLRIDTVSLCEDVQTAIFEAGFSFPVLSPAALSLDGSWKAQSFTFGRWDDWQSSMLTMS